MQSVKPWQWGLCEQWSPQDWLNFLMMTLNVESEPEVEAAAKRRMDAKGKAKPGGMSFNINRGEPLPES
jgi:hypothetical protein